MEKLLKNVIENPTEPKYRQIKKENAKLKEALICYKSGQDLMKGSRKSSGKLNILSMSLLCPVTVDHMMVISKSD